MPAPKFFDEDGNPLGDEIELDEADEEALDKAWAQLAQEKRAVVCHAHLYGVRETFNEEKEIIGGKYQWLSVNDVRTTEWKELKPSAPFYLFTPQDEIVREEYERGWKITDAMPVNVLGFQTHRDHFAIDFDKDELKKRINDLRETKLTDSEVEILY